MPLETLRLGSGSWSMTRPLATVEEYSSLTEPLWKKPLLSISESACSWVRLRRFGTAFVAELPTIE